LYASSDVNICHSSSVTPPVGFPAGNSSSHVHVMQRLFYSEGLLQTLANVCGKLLPQKCVLR